MILIQSAKSKVSWEITKGCVASKSLKLLILQPKWKSRLHDEALSLHTFQLTRQNCKKHVSLSFKDLLSLLYVNNKSCVLGNISEICGMRKAVISVTISVTVITERVASGYVACSGMLKFACTENLLSGTLSKAGLVHA